MFQLAVIAQNKIECGYLLNPSERNPVTPHMLENAPDGNETEEQKK